VIVHVDILEHEGMPLCQSTEFGKLYVTYHLIFPATVDDEFVKDMEFAFQSRKTRIAGSKKDEL
jgi:DnaJ-class molecular chaperone